MAMTLAPTCKHTVVQTEEEGMAACITAFKVENPGEWIIGILSSAGVDGDQALIKTLNAGGTADVTWVVGGHDHDPFFRDKESLCLEGTGSGATFMCRCVEFIVSNMLCM